MVKKHLKTLTVPVSWPIKRKGQTFVTRPLPSKSYSLSLPISIIFKDILKYCKTSNEVKTILRDKEVLVDGKRKKDLRSLVGFMDVLAIPLSGEEYRVLINKTKKLQLVQITKEESDVKVCKIISKTKLMKGKTQLNLFDGRNIIVKEDKYSVDDSVLIKLPSQEIKESFKMEKGNHALLISGTHTGEHGLIEQISKDAVTIKTKEGAFETSKKAVFVVGKEKPSIKMID
jgi:small subunit ribosomal protein S4e